MGTLILHPRPLPRSLCITDHPRSGRLTLTSRFALRCMLCTIGVQDQEQLLIQHSSQRTSKYNIGSIYTQMVKTLLILSAPIARRYVTGLEVTGVVHTRSPHTWSILRGNTSSSLQVSAVNIRRLIRTPPLPPTYLLFYCFPQPPSFCGSQPQFDNYYNFDGVGCSHSM